MSVWVTAALLFLIGLAPQASTDALADSQETEGRAPSARARLLSNIEAPLPIPPRNLTRSLAGRLGKAPVGAGAAAAVSAPVTARKAVARDDGFIPVFRGIRATYGFDPSEIDTEVPTKKRPEAPGK